jgi:hypothetical protein
MLKAWRREVYHAAGSGVRAKIKLFILNTSAQLAEFFNRGAYICPDEY